MGVLLTLLVFAMALVDLVISPRPTGIEVQREFADVMSVEARNLVKIWLRNTTPFRLSLEIHDEPPGPCAQSELPCRVNLGPYQAHQVSYHVEPFHRGRNRFGQVFLRCRSRLHFWELTDQRELPGEVKIYPNVEAVRAVELLARHNRVADAGVRLSLLRGRGTEFDRLREYRREDEFRSIDWKATARTRQLISREYVVERNQNIVFLLDCGRSMCNELDGITHFDRALNAAILLSYIALRQGDSISWLACSHRVEKCVPTLRGATAMQSLVRQTFDLEPNYHASDYQLMAEQLRQRHRKRSLVVLLTHAIDEVHLRDVGRSLKQLQFPHLVLGAFLKNVPLVNRMQCFPRTDLEAFQVAAAASLVEAQSRQIMEFEQHGLLVIDALPDQLSSQLISRYLDIKARHLL
jgi:uncharacterized protein (DUF58 family)